MVQETADLRPVYAVIGGDRFLRNEALRALLGNCEEGLGPTVFEGARAELADVLDSVRTYSLLGDRSIVIVDDADPFVTAHRKVLEQYTETASESGVLILAVSSMPRSTRLFKFIQKVGGIITCEALKGRAVNGWIVDRARTTYGKQVTAPAAARLRDMIGDAPGALDAELSKLSTYVGDRKQITPQDIGSLVGHLREEKVFAVTDAISSGNTAEALSQWEQVLATDRAAPGRAIAGMAWGIRRLLEARRELDGGTSVHALARRLYTDPGVLESRLKRVTVQALEGQLSDLGAADLAVKTGGSTLERAVERFIVTHTMAGDRAVGAA